MAEKWPSIRSIEAADRVRSGYEIMPKTVMAPRQAVLPLGIILLLASHLGNTLSPQSSLKDSEADYRNASQATAEKDSQQEPETSKFLSIPIGVNYCY